MTTPIKFYPTSFLNKGAVRSIDRFLADNEADILPVMEIFHTYEGEGSKIGTPRILVRLGGCPVMCKNCDTIHSFNVNKKMMKYQTMDQIVARVLELAIPDGVPIVREVSITGGEPMMYADRIAKLSQMLRNKGFKTSLETSGMIIDQPTFAAFDFISLDVKAPSTGVAFTEEQLRAIYMIRSQHQGTQIKIVISDENDLEWVLKNMGDFLNTWSHNMPLIMTPNAPYMKEGQQHPSVYMALMEMILKWNKGYNIVVIPQIHKLLSLDPAPEYL